MPVFLKQEKKCYSQKTPASRSLALLHEVVLWAGYLNFLGFPGGSVGIESSCQCRRPGSIPGSERYPGEGNGNTLQATAWEIPWTEEPGRLQSMGSQRVRDDLVTTPPTAFLTS